MPSPLTVLDTLGRPMRDLRVSVTDRCNFRCGYCMPREAFGPDHAFLPREEILTFEEIERVVRATVDLGIRKVRLTGGEPLVRRNLEALVAMLATVVRGLLDLRHGGIEKVARGFHGCYLEEVAADRLGEVATELRTVHAGSSAKWCRSARRPECSRDFAVPSRIARVSATWRRVRSAR